MQDFAEFYEECERAPRLHEFANFFSSTAGGRSGRPLSRPRLDHRLLPKDPLLDRFAKLHELRQGPFDQHYLSSIPYRFEEECRLGYAILKYAQARRKPMKFYSLGTAEGTMARTISELSQGRVQTLSCSPNIENLQSFYAYGVPPHARFFHGPFHHLTPERIDSDDYLQTFADGFDIILEDTTFQMYSPNRYDQIRFVRQHLRKDGLFMFVEKFLHNDKGEYRRREKQKDSGFKIRHFSDDDIKTKEDVVLNSMDKNEITLEQMVQIVIGHFSHCVVTWNSGNFYTIVAGDHTSNIDRFVGGLSSPAIPAEYAYEALPLKFNAAHR